MGSNKFIGQGIFFFARARTRIDIGAYAHAYERFTKRVVFSAILIALANFAAAASKETLFTNLSSESDPVKRISILAQLGAAQVGANDISKIEPSLQDADALVRAQAVAVLGNVGHKSVVDPLANTLRNDTDPGVRSAAAFWLGCMKNPTAVAALEYALLNDAEANVRTQAAQALKKIGTAGAKSSLRRGKSDQDKRVKKLANE